MLWQADPRGAADKRRSPLRTVQWEFSALPWPSANGIAAVNMAMTETKQCHSPPPPQALSTLAGQRPGQVVLKRIPRSAKQPEPFTPPARASAVCPGVRGRQHRRQAVAHHRPLAVAQGAVPRSNNQLLSEFSAFRSPTASGRWHRWEPGQGRPSRPSGQRIRGPPFENDAGAMNVQGAGSKPLRHGFSAMPATSFASAREAPDRQQGEVTPATLRRLRRVSAKLPCRRPCRPPPAPRDLVLPRSAETPEGASVIRLSKFRMDRQARDVAASDSFGNTVRRLPDRRLPATGWRAPTPATRRKRANPFAALPTIGVERRGPRSIQLPPHFCSWLAFGTHQRRASNAATLAVLGQLLARQQERRFAWTPPVQPAPHPRCAGKSAPKPPISRAPSSRELYLMTASFFDLVIRPFGNAYTCQIGNEASRAPPSGREKPIFTPQLKCIRFPGQRPFAPP